MRKFKDIEVSDAIKAMKDRLKENRLSLLIGAGASHCACSLYPLWNELLADMVAFLYADELKSKGVKAVRDDRYYCHYKLEKARKNSSVDIQDVVKGIIAREGALRIPEQFERRIGLRESVEAYIESHTPRLQDDGTVTLFDNKAQLGPETEFLVRMMDVRWNSVFTTNYDNLIGYVLEKNGILRMTESNCASDLSLRNMRETIVKLHGSIDFEHTSVGFDSDNHRKYIISQKDYDEYPVKHEAFMQLMRISLLKDCLCLVGFSGKDPNFISWINWVRDIIARDSRTIDSEYPKAEDIKVFFIDAIDEPEDEATMQYFENHRIYRIRLTDENVLKMIGDKIPEREDLERENKILFAFFDYLKEEDGSQVTLDDGQAAPERPPMAGQRIKTQSNTDGQSGGDDSKKEERRIHQETNSLWSKAYRLTGNRFDKIEIDEDAATRLLRSSPYMRIVKGTHFQSYFVDEIREKDVLSELEAGMALLALEQMQGDYGNDYQDVIGKIENTLAEEEFRERISRLRNRHDTLCDPFVQADGEYDMVVYERCARLAFTFRFKELKEALMSWHPSEDFVIKKLVLLRLVDADAVNGILSQSLLDSIHPANERFRATQIAEILSGNASGTYSLDEFADLSQHSIYSLRDWYFGNMIAPRERITAYGNDSEDRSEVNPEYAVRCLNFLLETPAMPQIGVWNIVSSTQWYKVAQALFEKYPYPVIFYSSTMNDTGTLKRIGQDYAYSDVLHGRLPDIVKQMFGLLTDKEQPKSFWTFRNICLLLCELVKATPPSNWVKYLSLLWKEHHQELFEDSHISDAILKLMYAGLSCSRDDELVAMVINDCLKSVRENKKYHIVQDLFYYLKISDKSRRIEKLIETSLSEYIEGINDYNDFILLGNLHRVISKSFYREIAGKIPSVVNCRKLNSSSVNGLIYFAKSDPEILGIARKALLASGRLWANGISEGSTVQADFIPVVELEGILEWTDDEVRTVYRQLADSARQILKRKKHSGFEGIFRYDELVFEMIRFIDLHRAQLSGIEGVDELYDELAAEYVRLTGFANLDKSLFSDNVNEVEASLEVLGAQISKDGIRPHIDKVNVLVTRLLCRNRTAYSTVLDNLQYFVRTYLKNADDLVALPQISLLTGRLTLDEFRSLEQNVKLCSELAILLADGLRKLGMTGSGIDYWIELKESRYFNWTICVEE